MIKMSEYRRITSNGYVNVRDVNGILGKKNAIVPEHRLIVSAIIGRPLRSDEMVHHIDLNKANNSPDNLAIVSAAEHGEIHSNGNVIRKKKKKEPVFSGSAKYVKLKCPWCEKIFYKPYRYTVLAHDNKLHVNCCCAKCLANLEKSIENNECSDMGRRLRENIVCEFMSNGHFMENFIAGIYPSYWYIDDNGVFHGDD